MPFSFKIPGLVPGIFLFASVLCPVSFASVDALPSACSSPVLQEYIHKADSLKLWEAPRWLALGHYRPQMLGAYESDVDGGYFILASDGKNNPESELKTTLCYLLDTANLAYNYLPGISEKMHPLLRFPARKRFLQSALGIPDSVFPAIDMNRFLRWQKALDPDHVSVIFASSYLGNPASVMGHSFLRLHSKRNTGSREILDYGVNYAAQVPPTDGMLFPVKGIAGMYPGNYGLLPFYLSLQKYSNIENRDLWTYHLSLPEESKQYFLEHLWELGNSWMHYFFFSENCSYNMLTLLQPALPDKDLLQGFSGTVVPIETVRILLDYSGLVDSVTYRPALMTQINFRARALAPKDREAMTSLAVEGPLSKEDSLVVLALDTVSRVRVLDLALDYAQVQKRNYKTDGWNQRHSQLMALRSKYHQLPDRSMPARDSLQTPDWVHRPERFSVQMGVDHFQPFTDFDYRYTYHEFNDPSLGLREGFQLRFLQARLRVQQHSVVLREFHGLDLASLNSEQGIVAPKSWRVHLYADRPESKEYQGKLTPAAEGLIGITSTPSNSHAYYGFFLAGLRSRFNASLDYSSAVGPLLWTGARIRLASNLYWWNEAEYFQGLGWSSPTETLVLSELRWMQEANQTWAIQFSNRNHSGSAGLLWSVFF